MWPSQEQQHEPPTCGLEGAEGSASWPRESTRRRSREANPNTSLETSLAPATSPAEMALTTKPRQPSKGRDPPIPSCRHSRRSSRFPMQKGDAIRWAIRTNDASSSGEAPEL